ncbi:S-methyl-5-thioribose-1-phosphate isomerase [Hippea maritima]|uniref:Methylthioribose-1-phosphate isomerase n=1 Tax=Hippea maritima (strain ATCC 700847 / DSM 10411 / MH2) TaxID=760142 RepID=F2LVJ1_HIPMA|nr:S-methyl-5-thioribose-1-phosphate isomerase [Hippea maritima]AEA33775.1 translation initiation factor, aIF-2BI family [Hippea maritima DSM 10411]
MKSMDGYSPIVFNDNDELLMLNQLLLPKEKLYVKARDVDSVCKAIKDMIVRGAPLIGIVAAFGVYLGVRECASKDELLGRFNSAVECLSKTRPTAVNLFYALDRMKAVVEDKIDILPVYKLIKKLRATAFTIWEEQKQQDEKIGQFGANFLKGKRRILTHCNTGSLATGGIGTALGIIKTMHRNGMLDIVYVDETRPYLQGARLTAFELKEEGIPFKIVTDNSCGMLARYGLVDGVIVGADRIARNGDTANKIGTYCLATMCKRHNITFVVAAPESTIDRNIASAEDIPIEERSKTEVLNCGGVRIAPNGSEALNFSFDITDSELIDAIITEKGVYRYPYEF